MEPASGPVASQLLLPSSCDPHFPCVAEEIACISPVCGAEPGAQGWGEAIYLDEIMGPSTVQGSQS